MLWRCSNIDEALLVAQNDAAAQFRGLKDARSEMGGRVADVLKTKDQVGRTVQVALVLLKLFVS